MKLDFDIVRDLLLDCEENLGLNEFFQLSTFMENSIVSDEEIYAAMKLNEAGFIEAKIQKYLDGNITILIKSITWTGHQFLDNIRPKQSWDKVKDIAKKLGGASITLLAEIAPKVTAELINSQFGL